MTKTFQVETEDDFFDRMRSLAKKVDRQEFFGEYENSSFEDRDEMSNAVAKACAEAIPTAEAKVTKKLGSSGLRVMTGRLVRRFGGALTTQAVATGADDGSVYVVTSKKGHSSKIVIKRHSK